MRFYNLNFVLLPRHFHISSIIFVILTGPNTTSHAFGIRLIIINLFNIFFFFFIARYLVTETYLIPLLIIYRH